MEVLNAAGLTTTFSLNKPTSNKPSSLKTRKLKLFHFRFSKHFNGGLAALSSVLCSNGSAKALSYEEALNQSVTANSDFDVGQFLDGVLQFATDNPLVISGGAALVVVPLILSQILKKSDDKSWGVESAKNAFVKLSEAAEVQLLDIREGREFKEVGSPDVRSLKKKAVSVVYRGEDKPGFLKKLALKFKDPENTTLFILDKFDGNSQLVAELVTANGFKAAYAIKDGAEGARGWMNSGLPWSPPKKALSLDFDNLKDAITGAIGEGLDGLSVTLGLAAATGLGVLAFTEMETVLQLLGSAALVQFVTKKLLFAENRKVTLQQAEDFLNTKVAPKELVGEIQMIGKALLPPASSVKTRLSAPAEPSPDTSSPIPVLTADTASETKAEPREGAAAVPVLAVNSVPKAEISQAPLLGVSRPLSPYPYYPDFKPPSSPSPAKP